MNAVIGPSGCGKTTLLKGLLGLANRSEGTVDLDGAPVNTPDDMLGRVGFAPQFSIAHPKLTVAESLRFHLELLVREPAERARRFDKVIGLVGLAAHADKQVANLSGGQLRRLGLALELITDPVCLFCDEVTSGLDPQSEEMVLELLRRLCREEGKTVVCVIHNLGRMAFFDRVTVLHHGRMVYEGGGDRLPARFGIGNVHDLYDRLEEEPVEHWVAAWERKAEEGKPGDAPPPEPPPPAAPANPPGAWSQTGVLLRRRLRLMVRDRGYLGLTLAITFGFPLLVVIFALGGLPQIESLRLAHDPNFLEAMRSRMEFQLEASRTATLVSGLVMFQVILLTLMGSNNGAREIAAERPVYEKERLSGLHPAAYVASKALFVTGLGLFQGAWMAGFVKVVCGFPGPWSGQILALGGTAAAMSLVCLGLSSLFSSAERASLLSIYLVGFQLPLSGVVLALPDSLVWLVRPFISAYWGWAGYLTTMKDTRLYDAVIMYSDTWLSPVAMAAAVLGLHAVGGLLMAVWGCHRRAWT